MCSMWPCDMPKTRFRRSPKTTKRPWSLQEAQLATAWLFEKKTTPCPSIFRSKNPWSWRESWVILENRLANNGDCWPFSGVMHIFSIVFATCDLYNFGKFRDERCWSSMEPWEVVGEKLKAITVCQIILDALIWLYWDTVRNHKVVSPTSIIHDFVCFLSMEHPQFCCSTLFQAKCLAQLCRMHLLAREYGFPERKWGKPTRFSKTWVLDGSNRC